MTDASRPRICVFSERLAPPFDEGIKNVALEVIRELFLDYTLLSLTTFGEDVPEYGIRNLRAGKSLLSAALGRAIRTFSPDMIVYIPTASHTLASFLRARVLGWYAPGARVHMIALQPRSLGRAGRLLIPRLCPHRVWVQSDRSAALLRSLGCRVGMFPGGVDGGRFRPVSSQARVRMRARYDLPEDAFVVLHVGHINANRNVELLSRVQELHGCQAVLVGSTSTPQDVTLTDRMRERGVRVITHFLAHVEELYQLSDCYFFPVLSSTGCIEAPLSILEAMACDLPVVTTRYGGIPQQFPLGDGLLYGDDAEGLLHQVEVAKSMRKAGTRAMVEPFTWRAVLRSTILREDV